MSLPCPACGNPHSRYLGPYLTGKITPGGWKEVLDCIECLHCGHQWGVHL